MEVNLFSSAGQWASQGTDRAPSTVPSDVGHPSSCACRPGRGFWSRGWHFPWSHLAWPGGAEQGAEVRENGAGGPVFRELKPAQASGGPEQKVFSDLRMPTSKYVGGGGGAERGTEAKVRSAASCPHLSSGSSPARSEVFFTLTTQVTTFCSEPVHTSPTR